MRTVYRVPSLPTSLCRISAVYLLLENNRTGVNRIMSIQYRVVMTVPMRAFTYTL
jgi:hypothetical protein